MGFYRKKKDDPLTVEYPIEKFVLNNKEEETFKLLRQLNVNMHNSGCTCFCKEFMLFVSDRYVDCEKSRVLQAFAGVNSVQKFMEMSLPLSA